MTAKVIEIERGLPHAIGWMTCEACGRVHVASVPQQTLDRRNRALECQRCGHRGLVDMHPEKPAEIIRIEHDKPKPGMWTATGTSPARAATLHKLDGSIARVIEVA